MCCVCVSRAQEEAALEQMAPEEKTRSLFDDYMASRSVSQSPPSVSLLVILICDAFVCFCSSFLSSILVTAVVLIIPTHTSSCCCCCAMTIIGIKSTQMYNRQKQPAGESLGVFANVRCWFRCIICVSCMNSKSFTRDRYRGGSKPTCTRYLLVAE